MSFDNDAYNDGDTLYEECGVFGVYGNGEAASLTAFGLHALQHRGQEATGIVSLDGREFHVHKAPEMVGKAFADPGVITMLKGNIAIGHNRYATAGDGSDRNIQPLYADLSFGGFAIAHNGNLTNAGTLRRELVIKGSLFQCTSDTEVIVHLMAVSAKDSPIEKLVDALTKVKGAYSIVACTEGKLIGVRDPHGIRPLVLGRLGDAHILASESCALDIIGAEFVRDIEPGELVVLDAEGVHSKRPFAQATSRFCIFEYIYFARPDSFMEGHSVYETRKAIGMQLAREAPCPGAEMIVPVPDSGVPAAMGFARESGVPFELGIIRSHYIGRTFIQPGDSIRHLGVRMKHNANRALIDGKKIVLVDDSIVRGTTSRKIVDMMRQAGAAEVHMRISAPPTAHPCFYGIDTPMAEDLIAHKMSTDEIAKLIGVDSLAYITVDGLYKAMGEAKRNNDVPQYCDACFTGDYAIELTDQQNQSLSKKVTSLQEHKARK